MAYRERQKISQMTPKGSNLAATDLIEVSELVSGTYQTKSITGQEIINAASGGGIAGGDLTGTYPNPIVHKVHGVDMQSGTPTADDTWVYGGSPAKWQHQKLQASQVTNDSSVSGTDVDDALNSLNTTKVSTTRTISTTAPLSGGGDLSVNRTLSIATANTTTTGALSSTDWNTFNNKQNALGFTAVPTTRTLTINGTALDLSADRSWTISTGLTIGTTAITSGTVGRILFEGTGNVVQEDSALFWDNTNKRLGIGATPSTSVRLDVRAQGSLSTDIAFRVRNSADTANIVQINGDGSQAWVDPLNNSFTTIRSGSSTLIQWSNTNFLNIGIGHGHTMTATDYYNISIGGGSTISSGTSEAIKIGTFGTSTGNGSINIGYAGRVNGSYTTKIGRHTGISSFGGTNSIHLGRTDSANDITPDNVFMTYFNSQSCSTVVRSNGSLGLFGQQNYLITNGTGANGLTTFMGDGGNTLVVRNHTSVPSLNITDSFQVYSKDIVAGNAAPHFRTENGAIIKLYQETTAVGSATFASGGGGTNMKTDDTFDGYSLQQVVKALRNLGILA